MEIRLLLEKDIDKAFCLIQDVIKLMMSKQIDQWDAIYPNSDTIKLDIDEKHAFGLFDNQKLIGYIVLNNLFSPAYNLVNWEYLNSRFLVVHRLAIHVNYQGLGYAKQLMRFAEEYAKSHDYDSIRLDAFVENPRAVKFYENLNFNKVGEAEFRKGLFYCFEKAIK